MKQTGRGRGVDRGKFIARGIGRGQGSGRGKRIDTEEL